MSVAPTGAVLPLAAVETRLSCAHCGARVSLSNAFCAACGAANAVPTDRKGRPVDLAATRSLQMAVLLVIANIVIGAIGLGTLVMSGSQNLVNAGLGLELLHLVVIGSLVAATIRLGVRGIQETRSGQLGRRNWAVLSVVVASLVGLVLAGSFTATLVMFLHQ